MHEPLIYVASAGTGKTTTLVNKLVEVLESTHPSKILFTTFTNAGANEIISRVEEKTGGRYAPKDFPWFRTLHSVAYRNIEHKGMLKVRDLIQFGRVCKYPISGGQAINTADGSFRKGAMAGDILIQLNNLGRSTRKNWEQIASEQTCSSFTANQLDKFHRGYVEYRKEIGKYDFTDQLENFLRVVESHGCPFPVEHIIVDEAQDLSNLQWAIIKTIHEKHSIPLTIAGDDKQSIYEFSGACPETLIQMPGTRKILDTSYRVPEKILEYAEKIAGRIQKKQEYFSKSANAEGRVFRINGVDDLPLEKESWFFLVRNRFMMGMVENEIIQRGYPVLTDNKESPFNPENLQAVHTWKQLQRGEKIPGNRIKALSAFLPSRKAVRWGFMKMWSAIHEDEYLDWEQLNNHYGLETRADWHRVLSLPASVKEVLLRMEEKGSLESVPRIRVSTIHGVKGQEADNVVVFPDMSAQTYRTLNQHPDSEHRVFYVAVTRAKKQLFLHEPFTEYFYPL